MNFKLVFFSCLISLAFGQQICPKKCDCEKETLNCTLKELDKLPNEPPVAVRYAQVFLNRIMRLS